MVDNNNNNNFIIEEAQLDIHPDFPGVLDAL